jgi:hypothetical protein
MIVLDIPKSGRCRDVVFYRLHQRQFVRRHVIPLNPKTSAQGRVRDNMTAVAKAWANRLTEEERLKWIRSSPAVLSQPRLGQCGPLSGQMHFMGINCVLATIGRELLREPPERVRFGPNPVGELTLSRRQGELNFELAVSGPVTEDIMVFGAAPCPAGRRKCRKPVYLGLLPAPVDGVSDITALYLERFGEPEPGRRIFIRTLQQRHGWQSAPVDTSNLVPARDLDPQRCPSTSSFIIPTSSFAVLPCPRDVHAVRTVCARWMNHGRTLPEGEHRTLNLEPRTLNQPARGFRCSRFEVQGSRFKVRPPSQPVLTGDEPSPPLLKWPATSCANWGLQTAQR